MNENSVKFETDTEMCPLPFRHFVLTDDLRFVPTQLF